jgi:hypothetical protein
MHNNLTRLKELVLEVIRETIRSSQRIKPQRIVHTNEYRITIRLALMSINLNFYNCSRF